MEKFENHSENRISRPIVSERVYEIALRAAEMTIFQDAAREAPNKVEAIKLVRELLKEEFPEIERMPEPRPGSAQRPIGFIPPNEFFIAKNVVELLHEKSKGRKVSP